MAYQELVESLTKLKLSAMKKEFSPLADLALKEKKSFEQYLAMLTRVELEHRLEARLKRLLKDSKLPKQKDLGEYDFAKIEPTD